MTRKVLRGLRAVALTGTLVLASGAALAEDPIKLGVLSDLKLPATVLRDVWADMVDSVALVCRDVSIAVANGDIRIDVSNLEYGDADDEDLGIMYIMTFCQACIDRLALPVNP